MTHRIRILVSASIAAIALSLSACSSEEPTLPTIGGEKRTDNTLSTDLLSTAKAFHDCLTDAAIPAIYQGDTTGQPTIVTIDSNVKALGVDPQGNSFSNEGTTDEEKNDFFKNRDMSIPVLEIDGINYTDAWSNCFTQTGYSFAAVMEGIMSSPYGQDLFRLLVDSSNQWAACARNNGFPDTKDAVMPTESDMSEVPAALLAASITEPQLRELLNKCPHFNAEQQRHNDELISHVDASDPTKWLVPDGYIMIPSIGFDYPGFNGRTGNLTTGTPENPGDKVAQKLTKLRFCHQRCVVWLADGWQLVVGVSFHHVGLHDGSWDESKTPSSPGAPHDHLSCHA